MHNYVRIIMINRRFHKDFVIYFFELINQLTVRKRFSGLRRGARHACQKHGSNACEAKAFHRHDPELHSHNTGHDLILHIMNIVPKLFFSVESHFYP